MQQYAWLCSVPFLDYVEYAYEWSLMDVGPELSFHVGYKGSRWNLDTELFYANILFPEPEDIPRALASRKSDGSLFEALMIYRLNGERE